MPPLGLFDYITFDSGSESVKESEQKVQAQRRAQLRMFNGLNQIVANMTPEQGSSADQMKDLYYGTQGR